MLAIIYYELGIHDKFESRLLHIKRFLRYQDNPGQYEQTIFNQLNLLNNAYPNEKIDRYLQFESALQKI